MDKKDIYLYYRERENNMKLNLKTREEGKINIGCAIYMSDKIALEEVANELGVPISLLLRSVINDIIERKITF